MRGVAKWAARCLFAAILATPAVAQSGVEAVGLLDVTVHDRATHRALRASVVLRSGDGAETGGGETDSTGVLRVPVPRVGSYRVEVRSLGYAPYDTVVYWAGVPGLAVLLSRISPVFDTVRVKASMPSPFLAEYVARRARGIGRFLAPELFAETRDTHLSLMLASRFAGVRAVPLDSRTDRYRLISTRSRGGGVAKAQSTGPCPVDVYLDGMRYDEDLDAIPPREVAGAELYSMGQAPVQYRRSYGACHVLLLWSR